MISVMNNPNTIAIRITLSTLIAIFLGALVPEVKADTPVRGMGVMSCGQYLESRRMDHKLVALAVEAWIQGFISGRNIERFDNDTFTYWPVPAPETLLAYMDKYCKDNPLKSLFTGSIQLLQEVPKVRDKK
jgi:hypothetical protein